MRDEHRRLLIAISMGDFDSVRGLVLGGEPREIGHVQKLYDEKPKLKIIVERNNARAEKFLADKKLMRQKHGECTVEVAKFQEKLREIDENLEMIAEDRLCWDRDAEIERQKVATHLQTLRAQHVAQVIALGSNPPFIVKELLKGLCLLRGVRPAMKSTSKTDTGSENKVGSSSTEEDWIGPGHAL